MSLTIEEVAAVKQLLKDKAEAAKPKQKYTYTHKNQIAEIERELTPAELKDWKERIDKNADV